MEGRGDGSFAPDAELGTAEAPLSVRAERSGSGTGRVYHVAVEATDGRGGTCTATVQVCVPHDLGGALGGEMGCTDEGPMFDSTAP